MGIEKTNLPSPDLLLNESFVFNTSGDYYDVQEVEDVPGPESMFIPYYLCSCLVALMAVSVFLRVDFLIKLIIMILTSVVHILLIAYPENEYFMTYYGGHRDG